jgi:PAS domain S-box-containing protein
MSPPCAQDKRGGRRWLVTLVFAVLCLVVVGGIAAFALRQVGRELASLIADDSRDLYLVQKLQTDSEHAARTARSYLFTGDERFVREMEASRAAIREELREAHRIIDSPQGRRLLSTIEQAQAAAWREMDGAIEQRRQGNVEESIRRVLQGVQPWREELDRAFTALVEHKHARLERHQQAVSRGTHRAFLLVLGTLGLVLLVTVALALYMRRATRQEERSMSALRESQAKLQAIIDHAPSIIYAKDAEGRLLLVNQRFEEQFQLRREEALGKKDSELFQKELVDRARSVETEVLDSGQARQSEVTIFLGGQPHTYVSEKFPLPDDSGRPYAVATIWTDITERRRAEEELHRAHARILSILEESGVAFHGLDRQWRITYVNKAAEPILKKKREELLGRVLWEVFPEAVDTVYWNQYRRALQEQVPVHFEGWYEPLQIWTEVRAQPCAEGLSVYFLDITARKQAEEEARENAEKFRALASASFDGIVIHEGGIILEANESYARMFGHTVEEVVGCYIYRFIVPEERERITGIIESGQIERYEAVGLHRDGSRIHVEVIARYMEYRGRRVRGAAMRDITDRKRMSDYEQKLLGIVGHDLRSPLSAILASVDLLMLRGDLTAPQTKAVARVRRSAERMRGLITTMLDYTRERAGAGVPIAPAPVCFHEVGARVLEDLRAAHPERQFVCDASGDTCGRWDPVRLEQVAMNLLENAVKYGSPGSPVRAVYRGAGDQVVFSVHNEGKPIPRELLPHLFEPFRRGEQTERTVRQSAGLGLFIVKSIVSAHGGDIHVSSTRDGGTTFTVLLPRSPPSRQLREPAVEEP